MGKGISDVSGDYNLFSSSKTITVGDLSVLLRGTDKGYSLATWNDGTYSYSVDITGATLSEDVFTSIITSIQ